MDEVKTWMSLVEGKRGEPRDAWRRGVGASVPSKAHASCNEDEMSFVVVRERTFLSPTSQSGFFGLSLFAFELDFAPESGATERTRNFELQKGLCITRRIPPVVSAGLGATEPLCGSTIRCIRASQFEAPRLFCPSFANKVGCKRREEKKRKRICAAGDTRSVKISLFVRNTDERNMREPQTF